MSFNDDSNHIMILGLPLGREEHPGLVHRQLKELSFELLVSLKIPVAPELILNNTLSEHASKVDLLDLIIRLGSEYMLGKVLLAVPDEYVDEHEMRKLFMENEEVRTLLSVLEDVGCEMYVSAKHVIQEDWRGALPVDEWMEEREWAVVRRDTEGVARSDSYGNGLGSILGSLKEEPPARQILKVVVDCED